MLDPSSKGPLNIFPPIEFGRKRDSRGILKEKKFLEIIKNNFVGRSTLSFSLRVASFLRNKGWFHFRVKLLNQVEPDRPTFHRSNLEEKGKTERLVSGFPCVLFFSILELARHLRSFRLKDP